MIDAKRQTDRAVAFILTCVLATHATHASSDCTIVNLMPTFWTALGSEEAAVQLRARVVEPHSDVYNASFVNLPADSKWLDEVARERSYVESHRAEIVAVEKYLIARVPQFMREFARKFPDYRCDFTFYIGPSFGHMDGSAARVNGEHRILFAPDVIPRLHRTEDLKVLIDHETFHIYHHQATAEFGATEEAVPTILNALWTEGLATFVSWRMNPNKSLDIAMLQPGIPEGAQPHLAAIASDMIRHADEHDEPIYGRYFMGNRQPEGYPPRSGYYVGMLIAERLSRHYSLSQLAHLKGAPLHAILITELTRLAEGR